LKFFQIRIDDFFLYLLSTIELEPGLASVTTKMAGAALVNKLLKKGAIMDRSSLFIYLEDYIIFKFINI